MAVPLEEGGYDRFLDSSPEDQDRQKSSRSKRGFDTDFGIYGDRKYKPPPMTLKEFNKRKKEQDQRKSGRQGRPRCSRHPRKPPRSALRTLGTYGKMFKGDLLQDLVAVEGIWILLIQGAQNDEENE